MSCFCIQEKTSDDKNNEVIVNGLEYNITDRTNITKYTPGYNVTRDPPLCTYWRKYSESSSFYYWFITEGTSILILVVQVIMRYLITKAAHWIQFSNES